MPKNLLFVNTGSGRNLGDRAMLINMAHLSKELGAGRIWISADMPEAVLDSATVLRYPLFYHCLGRFSLERWPRFLLFLPLGFSLLFCLLLIAARRLCGTALPWGVMEAQMINAIADADAVIFSGGGYLTDKGKLESRACLLVGCFGLLLDKSIYMTGQGIGPFDSKLSEWLLAAVAKRAKKIVLRDPDESRNLLIDLGVPASRIVAIGDDAVTLAAKPATDEKSARRILAVNFRISRFTENVESSIQALQRVLLKMQAEGWLIRFFIFSEHAALEFGAIKQLTSAGISDYEVVQNADPRVLKAAIARSDLAIGVAYHFLVFALTTGVPAVGLYGGEYYRQKLQGLFEWYDMKDLVVPFDAIDSSALLAVFSKLLRDRPSISLALTERSVGIGEAHRRCVQSILEQP